VLHSVGSDALQSRSTRSPKHRGQYDKSTPGTCGWPQCTATRAVRESAYGAAARAAWRASVRPLGLPILVIAYGAASVVVALKPSSSRPTARRHGSAPRLGWAAGLGLILAGIFVWMQRPAAHSAPVTILLGLRPETRDQDHRQLPPVAGSPRSPVRMNAEPLAGPRSWPTSTPPAPGTAARSDPDSSNSTGASPAASRTGTTIDDLLRLAE
jgi:hypothetical protein